MISFPKLECWNNATQVATIVAESNKQRILCRISLNLLITKFGFTDKTPMTIVADHREEIHTAARRLITNGAFEADGSIYIRFPDL